MLALREYKERRLVRFSQRLTVLNGVTLRRRAPGDVDFVWIGYTDTTIEHTVFNLGKDSTR